MWYMYIVMDILFMTFCLESDLTDSAFFNKELTKNEADVLSVPEQAL